jgi:cytidylate kinase
VKILIMGLSGSGKTHLANRLQKELNCAWFNADAIRKMCNDWDFSDRNRQSLRMRNLADFETQFGNVICDFICPTEKTREIFNADFTIWMNTVKSSRYTITDDMFEKPNCDIEITERNTDMTDIMATYRQALRDLPANTADVFNPVYPEKP